MSFGPRDMAAFALELVRELNPGSRLSLSHGCFIGNVRSEYRPFCPSLMQYQPLVGGKQVGLHPLGTMRDAGS